MSIAIRRRVRRRQEDAEQPREGVGQLLLDAVLSLFFRGEAGPERLRKGAGGLLRDVSKVTDQAVKVQ
jgi:hypothetical protein